MSIKQHHFCYFCIKHLENNKARVFMKILHCSDIHLGRRPAGVSGDISKKRYNDYFTAFEYIIDYAINNNIEIILIAGDLFDRKELQPEVLERTEILLNKLKDNNIKCFAIEGNHDNIIPGRENESWINYLENKSLLLRPKTDYIEGEPVFKPINIGEVDIYGLGYPGGMCSEALIKFDDFISTKNDKNNKVILMVHTAIASDNYLPGTIEKETVDRLAGKVDYIAGGHFHSRNAYPKSSPFFFISGSPEYWDYGEYKQEKGFWIIETDNFDTEFHQSQKRKIHSFEIVFDSGDIESLNELASEKLDEIDIEQDEDIVVCNIMNKADLIPDIREIEDLIQSFGALKAIVRISDISSSSADKNTSRMTIEEIEMKIISSWDELGKFSGDIFEVFPKLKQYQAENMEDDFLDAFDSMLDKILDGGKNEN